MPRRLARDVMASIRSAMGKHSSLPAGGSGRWRGRPWYRPGMTRSEGLDRLLADSDGDGARYIPRLTPHWDTRGTATETRKSACLATVSEERGGSVDLGVADGGRDAQEIFVPGDDGEARARHRRRAGNGMGWDRR